MPIKLFLSLIRRERERGHIWRETCSLWTTVFSWKIPSGRHSLVFELSIPAHFLPLWKCLGMFHILTHCIHQHGYPTAISLLANKVNWTNSEALQIHSAVATSPGAPCECSVTQSTIFIMLLGDISGKCIEINKTLATSNSSTQQPIHPSTEHFVLLDIA